MSFKMAQKVKKYFISKNFQKSPNLITLIPGKTRENEDLFGSKISFFKFGQNTLASFI